MQIKKRLLLLILILILPRLQIMKQACKEKYLPDIQLLDNPQKKTLIQKFISADKRLSEDFQPEQVLCRDEQISKIKDFVSRFIATSHSKESLYISGVPGIGKTLCVNHVFQSFANHDQVKKGKVKFVRINAMNLKHAPDIYKNLYLEFCKDPKSKRKMTAQSALFTLDCIFRKNQMLEQDQQISMIKKVVLIDQIDFLKTKNEQVLYNLFDWTQSENSKLAIIAISNTIDFPEKLQQKIISRIGNCRIIFSHYNSMQVEKIIDQRVHPTEVFEKQAIRYISKILVKSSSDIRRCLSILRQSINIHLDKIRGWSIAAQKNSKIKMQLIEQSFDKITASLSKNTWFIERYKCMPFKYRFIIRYLGQTFERNPCKTVTLDAIKTIAFKQNISQKDLLQLLSVLMQLTIIELKYTIKQQRYKQWTVKLLIQSAIVLHASLRTDSQDFYS